MKGPLFVPAGSGSRLDSDRESFQQLIDHRFVTRSRNRKALEKLVDVRGDSLVPHFQE